jgi:hypothetical protein
MFREAKSLSIRRRDDKHSLRTSGDCLGNDVEPHRATTPLTGKVMAMRAIWLLCLLTLTCGLVQFTRTEPSARRLALYD